MDKMEIKDLVLLLMVPILLGGILFYADSITGAAVTDTKTNKIGEYSIKPNFKAKSDHNFDEYISLNQKLKGIIDFCIDDDLEKCLAAESERLGWQCDEKVEEILYNFVDEINDCLGFSGEKAICILSFDEIEKINDIDDTRIFEIRLTEDGGKINLQMMENKNLIADETAQMDKLIYTDYDGRDLEGINAESIILKIKYSDDKPSIDKFAAVKGGKETKLSPLFLYKSGNDVKFIDANFESSFEANAKDASSSTKTIRLPITKGMKFCAESDKEVMIYENGKLENRNIVYRFSVTFPKPIPPPVENVAAIDAVNAEKAAVLSWDADDDEIQSYNVYYSSIDFISMPVKGIKDNDEIKKISMEKEKAAEISDLDLENCRFDPFGEKCKYQPSGKSLDSEKLYYWKSGDKFIYYLDGIDDGITYFAAVTAVDDEGNEIDNDKTKEKNRLVFSQGKNFVQFSSRDDLAPMKITDLSADGFEQKLLWTKPLKNEDGSDSIDVSSFNIYYKKTTSGLSPQLEPGYSSKRITAAEAGCDSIAIACSYSVSEIPDLENKIYSFAVTALDENLNEMAADGTVPLLVS